MIKRVNKIKGKQIDAMLHQLDTVNYDHRTFKTVNNYIKIPLKILPYIMTKARLLLVHKKYVK